MIGHEYAQTRDFVDEVSTERKQEQLNRILESPRFVTAPGLQNFLRYVAEKAVRGEVDQIKEYAIAVDVLGKTHDFDPRIDTLVRTQANRLRTRLRQYYENEGAADEVIVELPRGHYVPRFMWQPAAVLANPAEPEHPADFAEPCVESAVPISDEGARITESFPRLSRTFLFTAGACFLFLAGLGIGSRWRSGPPLAVTPADAVASQNERELLGPLWAPFHQQGHAVIVTYSNPVFLTNNSFDLLYYRGQNNLPRGTQIKAAEDAISAPLLKHGGPLFFHDGFTGTGEVGAMHAVTRALTLLNTPMIVKRSSLLTTTDLHRDNVIFVGGSTMNTLLGDVGLRGAFLDQQSERPGPWRGRIVNVSPRPGESPVYEVERDAATQALRADYSLVSFMPGVGPGTRIAVLAGISTFGTQAAAEFSTSAAGVAEYTRRLGIQDRSGKVVLPPYFQAILRVEIAKGDVLRARYVTGRVLDSHDSHAQ
jgi:hypothetical protein